MNKLTKISISALLALFLTACDKPATQTVEVSKSETATTQSSLTSEEQEKADFKTMLEWNNVQNAVLSEPQGALQETLMTGDKTKIEAALVVYSNKVNEVLESLEAVDVKSESLIRVKEKTKETMVLSNDLIRESVKAMASPTMEAQQLIREKTQVLINTANELQQLQLHLQEKYMPQAIEVEQPTETNPSEDKATETK